MVARFIKVYDPAPDIEPASADAKDHAPLRGRKFCAPLNAASALGWYLYPPLNFHLNWDGRSFYCMLEGFEDWIRIDQLLFPDYAETFEQKAAQYGVTGVPPFLDVFPELGVIQIWTGYIVRTDPGESLWIRAPINIPGGLQYDVFDGIIETDWWCGGLITNIRFHKTDIPVSFLRHQPLAQVFTVPRALHEGSSRDKNFSLERGLDALNDTDWSDWKRDVSRLQTSGKLGSYIQEARKYRK
jgi:hypothetical protein